ncbi:MAG: gamma-glutamyl-gamma-aminobutyrate hydrolase family protein [Alphaproteobacteria bacterium]|nr:gamma-glutamyl-gamma-aminobutyrate hydrolase family protein [Alphaproteobacteria bacterium]MDE2111080.1 gamma-glutamyl-gamma-aminobutyrate hydrolase family protein [Alphaproteobacteria bacterium]MDE2494780.1 gamma-glutamyl-gamma-aminobutyrate hydrolase family protein [Alphaproteobacteria bacterium]
MSSPHPVVGLVCDHRVVGDHPFHMVGEKYINALRDGAGVLPLLIPALEPPLAIADLLANLDGFLFTGSPSNVSPRHYGGSPPPGGQLEDERRDETALPLLRAAVEIGKPVICICRGCQELNVAFGGTLHQKVHEVPGRIDHRERDVTSLDEQYAPVHPVLVAEGGLLARLTPARGFDVNSLHGQGIDQLAPALFADAVAPDGQIEAVSMPGAKGFLLGLQWHPEWRWAENTVSRAIFTAYGAALRK